MNIATVKNTSGATGCAFLTSGQIQDGSLGLYYEGFCHRGSVK